MSSPPLFLMKGFPKMLTDQRIVFSDNSSLTDISVNTGNFREGTSSFPYVAADDYLFIGSFLPFNHKHFDLSTPNDSSSTVSIDIWDGNQWIAAVDIIDQTALSGASLGQNGIISWSSDIDDSSWNREEKSADVTGLSGTKIYNMYWARFSWSSDLNAGTVIDYVGHKFAKDSEMYDVYPELNNSVVLDSFESGKTDWEEQHYLAADHIIRDLKKDNAIVSADQILDFEIFKEAAIHCAAMKIFWGLGQTEKHDLAKSKYESFVNVGFLNLDLNRDGRLNINEHAIRQGFLTR